jgi:ferredoxin
MRIGMSEESKKVSRRQFMIAGSAIVVTPALLDVSGATQEAHAASGASLKAKEKVYFITTNCVGCHTCKVFCPVKAIFYGERKMEIDQDKCVQCGTCYEECPTSSISEIAL